MINQEAATKFHGQRVILGIAVHDGFKPYRRYTNTQHALCNVHHLRELLGIIEPEPNDPKIAWAVDMDRLLREMRTAVTHARAAGQERLRPEALAGSFRCSEACSGFVVLVGLFVGWCS